VNVAEQPPTKRRTREHIIADLSENYVQRLFLERGHTCARAVPDYGYDLSVYTHDQEGYIEDGHIFLQLKATDDIEKYRRGDMFSYTIDAVLCRQWCRARDPVYFVLFDVQRRRAYWTNAQTYFRGLANKKTLKKSQKSVQIHVSRKNVMNLRAIDEIQKEKNTIVKGEQAASGGVSQ
jgi:hypothetical protein